MNLLLPKGVPTEIPGPMLTNSQFLTLTQWLSPAFPVGSYAYSHGVESAVEHGWIKDGTDLESWLEDVLLFGTGRTDSLLLAAAYYAKSRTELLQINQTAKAFAISAERKLESESQGRSFVKAFSVWGKLPDELTYPVAIGAAAKQERIPLKATQQLYLQAFMSNLVAAGQRLLAVGQLEGQEILRRLTQKCPNIADETYDGDLSKLASVAFLTDIASMQHESQNTRIFRT